MDRLSISVLLIGAAITFITLLLLRKMRHEHRLLRESEQRYRGLVELFPDTILVHQDGKIIFINPSGAKLLGADSPQEMLGRPIADIIHPDFRDIIQRRIQSNLTGKGNTTLNEQKLIRLDGTTIDVEATAVPIWHQNKVAVQVILRDITKQKKTQQKFSVIAENTSDFIAILNVNGDIKYCSPSHAVLGYPVNYLMDKQVLEYIHPNDRDSVSLKTEESIQTFKPIQVEFLFRRWDGNYIPLESKVSPVISANGVVEQIVVVSRDITERKKADEFIRKSERLAVVGQLAAGVAHEIRNPLTPIRGFIELLQNGSRKEDYFNIILSELDRLESIVNEFLFLAKPQATTFVPKDLSVIINGITSLLQTQAILNNIEIRAEIDPNIPQVVCEENRIKQVLINVVKNAIDSMPDGGEIMLSAKLKDNRVQIKIEDQGVGIPAERMAHLGEPFYTTKEKGTGLGLMISHKIIKDHQGEILYTSQQGMGTIVEILLPYYPSSL